MKNSKVSPVRVSGWRWVPSVYVYQGLPSMLVMSTSSMMYKDLGFSAESFAFWTSLVCLPWSFKPLWAPIVERAWTKRRWTLLMEFVLVAAFVALSLSFGTSVFYPLSLSLMLVIAFGSSFHDIACDGYYIMALEPKEQTFYVGIRSTFFRVATVVATGFIPFVAGIFQKHGYAPGSSWGVSVGVAAALMTALAVVNLFAMPKVQEPTGRQDDGLAIFLRAFKSFFTHEGAVPFLVFLMTYRLGESQLSKIVTPFLIDGREGGGLGLTVDLCGVVYGTVGTLALTIGGIAGGWLASKYGLRRLIWPMALLMNMPNLVYIALAHFQPEADSPWVVVAVFIEQLGYGFGFSAYTLCILRYVAKAEYKAAEYSIGTAFMSLGMLLPGMVAGYAASALGYELFFVLAVLLTIPGMLSIAFLPKNLKE